MHSAKSLSRKAIQASKQAQTGTRQAGAGKRSLRHNDIQASKLAKTGTLI